MPQNYRSREMWGEWGQILTFDISPSRLGQLVVSADFSRAILARETRER
jgi:hypothetical protein